MPQPHASQSAVRADARTPTGSDARGASLTDAEFEQFRRFMFAASGVAFPASKKALVAARLLNRVEQLSLPGFSAYLRVLRDPSQRAEAQTAVDLLTTNETYFFREPKHFELLEEHAARAAAERREFRVWSAACSSGEEPYSIAMVLADCYGADHSRWSVLGSDISSRMLQRARRAPGIASSRAVRSSRRAAATCSSCATARSTSPSCATARR